MKTYSFPYGAGEWDALIEVDITNKEAALLEESMKKNCYFHMSEDPTLAEIENKVIHRIFVENKKMRERILAFMYPSCIIGAIAALLMPSIFTTSISVNEAFTHPISYQFFIFHTMLIVLGINIGFSKEIKWEVKHIYSAILIAVLLGFISIYINSMLASPTYLNGELLYVDFWPNFMFTFDDPIGLNITTIEQWYLYLVVLILVVCVLVTLFFLPVIKRSK